MTFAGKSAGRTELRKHSLFKRLSAGTWPCREWAAFVSCFLFSTLAHTSLLMSGGAIPTNRYSSSVSVLQCFSIASILWGCGSVVVVRLSVHFNMGLSPRDS